MLIYIGEEAFSSPVSDATAMAVRRALSSREWGYNRVLVSPTALGAAKASGVDDALLDQMAVVQRSWLEGQSLLAILSRVVVLVDSDARHGTIVGNRYEVATARAIRENIFAKPCVITESMNVDGDLLKLYLESWLGYDARELSQNWDARWEQGGGSTTYTLIGRYEGAPEPMHIVVDRDTPGLPACGSTADACVRELVQRGIFGDRAGALQGGFSPNRAHFAFEVLRARTIECMAFPSVMALFFENLMNNAVGQARRAALEIQFPTFPTLSEVEAVEWLANDFRRYPHYAGQAVFGSNDIRRLVGWVRANEENRSAFLAAFRGALTVTTFSAALSEVLQTFLSLGIRENRLL